ncbi:MAG: ADP-ribosylglycohydrolase family protein [Candidatus Lokiarchaeota archaeon]|nr:ADP-ribosylglycohydrolase family protein [Candidatus Lokiarchaeota archaeon]
MGDVHTSLADRFKGTLVGLGAGDAFGAPFEFLKTRRIAERFGGKVTEFLDTGGVAGPGEFTDDTQMAWCIVEAILEAGDVDPGVVTAHFLRWLDSRPPDVGLLTRQVLVSIKAGRHWSAAAREIWEAEGGNDPRRNPRAGNGSLMRCAPVGLFRCFEPDLLVRDSIATSAITHYDPRCTWSCVVLNALIAKNLSRGSSDPPSAHAGADLAWMAGRVGDKCGALRMSLHELSREIVAVASGGKPFDQASEPFRDQGGYVLTTLGVALLSFYCTMSFKDAVIESANFGSDNDTTAAICGALAGSYYGHSRIPSDWLGKLKQATLLERKAGALLALVGRKTRREV